MEIDNYLFQDAYKLAKQHHKHQKYGNHDYFDFHIMGVVRSLMQSEVSYEFLIVACLHDAVEDSNLSLIDIEKQFNLRIRNAVDAITKRKDETREEYLLRCKSNDIARIVKLHDATFNATQCFLSKPEKFDYYINTIASLAN